MFQNQESILCSLICSYSKNLFLFIFVKKKKVKRCFCETLQERNGSRAWNERNLLCVVSSASILAVSTLLFFLQSFNNKRRETISIPNTRNYKKSHYRIDLFILK
jgi:hypothetical protein